MDDWAGMFVKSGTPDAVVTKINEAVVTAAKDPEVVATISALGTVLVGSTPAEFADFMAYQRQTVEKLVTELKLKPE